MTISIENARRYTESTEGTTTKTSSSKSNSANKTTDEFMGILMAQLTNQNPLEPMDDTAMVSQMVQMNTLTELQKISAAMTAMSQSNQFVSATNLMDKTVTYLNADQEPVTGVVSGVTMGESKIFLTVGLNSVEFSKIVRVSNEED